MSYQMSGRFRIHSQMSRLGGNQELGQQLILRRMRHQCRLGLQTIHSHSHQDFWCRLGIHLHQIRKVLYISFLSLSSFS